MPGAKTATTWKHRLALPASAASRPTGKVSQVPAALLVSTAPTCTQPAPDDTCSAWYLEAVLDRYICIDTLAGVTPTVLMQNSRPAVLLPALMAG